MIDELLVELINMSTEISFAYSRLTDWTFVLIIANSRDMITRMLFFDMAAPVAFIESLVTHLTFYSYVFSWHG